MEECVDGEYQDFKSKNGAYIREKFFGRYPETAAMVADWSDDQIWALTRGGHDPVKVFAAYKVAADHKGQPTVILAKTVKGYGMGEAGEGQMIAHQQKKLGDHALLAFRDRFHVPISDEAIGKVPFLRFARRQGGNEIYARKPREPRAAYLPAQRRNQASRSQIPELSAFDALLEGDSRRSRDLHHDGVRAHPDHAAARQERRPAHRADRARREPHFWHGGPVPPDRHLQPGRSALSPAGRRPTDVLPPRIRRGRSREEGINEPGAMASFIAAATSYSTSNSPMIPFYIYYSMFGFQRVGDLCWAAGDMRARGFLIGGTSGRTTLNGEGLQHEDGHSHVLASTIPNCISYDPTYAYELAVIIQAGLKRMYGDNEDVYYYITTLNENYPHPAMPEGAEAGILAGMYLLRARSRRKRRGLRLRLLGSGAILREVEEAAALLAKDFGVSSDIWSVTSFNELRRDGLEAERWNMLHPEAPPRISLCREVVPRARGVGPGGRRDRLYEGRRRRHPALRARVLQVARNRRLRPLRLSPPPALVL